MQHIHGFNALRAFSISLVMLSHVGIIEAAEHPIWKTVFSVFNANYGVKTFFVLSGFLITTLLIEEQKQNGAIDIRNFIVRRALRILPLYYLILTLLGVLIFANVAQDSWKALGYGAFYAFNFIPKEDSVNYLNHLWSLAVEEQYYLVWPLVFVVLFPRKGVLPVACILLIAACYFAWTHRWPQFSDTHYTSRWTIPAIYPILFGSLMAIATPKLHGALRSLPALFLSATAMSLPLFLTIDVNTEFAGTAGIAGLIAWVYLNQHRRFVRLMDFGPIGYVGVISYGLYMWQGILTGNGPYRVTPGWPPEPMIGALLTFIVAPLSYHYFEKPISNLRKNFKST